ncbi:MAG: P27 family phage terminase small subunit [Sphaerochaetaceae bacterium]
MGGRPRKPTMQKIIQGTFQKCRHPGTEPDPDSVPAEQFAPCPTGLHRKGRQFWKDAVKYMTECGYLKYLDLPTLELAALAYDKIWYLWKECVLKDDAGNRRTYRQYLIERGFNKRLMPELTEMTSLEKTFQTYSNMFGMNPVARSRISVLPQQETDPMEELLAKHGS